MTEQFRDRRRAFREQEIVRTAARVIAESGCRDFTMNEVASRLGISKATVYQHFRSRDELIRKCVGEACRVALEEARLSAERLPLDQRLHHAARYLVQRCLAVTGREDDLAPCCLAEIECPHVDWGDLDTLFAQLGARPDTSEPLGIPRALRALAASVLHDRKTEGRKPTPADVEGIIRFLFPTS